MDNEFTQIGAGRIPALRKLIQESKDEPRLDELLIPEITWMIQCAPLNANDREFARLRFVEGYTLAKCGEKLCWYSKNTPTKHNKKVSAILWETLKKLLAE